MADYDLSHAIYINYRDSIPFIRCSAATRRRLARVYQDVPDVPLPPVLKNGIILIDDYYRWEGCALAVNEYLDQNHLKHVIKPLPYYHGAYFEKRDRW